MSKSEAIHELYEICKDIGISESSMLISDAGDKDEAGFIRVITDYILQQKQKKVIEEKRF